MNCSRFIITLLAAALAASCGGGGGGDSQDGIADDAASFQDVDAVIDTSPDIPPDSIDTPVDTPVEEEPPSDWAAEICLRMVSGLCDYTAACCDGSEAALQQAEWNLNCADVPSSLGYTECYAWVSGLLASPHVHVDAGRVETCLSQYASFVADCPGPSPVAGYYLMTVGRIGDCDGMFFGDLAAGVSCAHSDECAVELYCHAGDGVCRPRAGADSACTANDQCTRGMVCSSTGTCRTMGTGGEACITQLDCRLDHRCDTASMPVVCRTFKQAGENCAAYAECASGTCDTSVTPNRCTGFCDG